MKKLAIAEKYAKGGYVPKIGDLVHITDRNSLMKGKSGVVLMKLSEKENIVKVLDNGTERNVVVSTKGLQNIQAMETGGTADSAMSNNPMIGGTMASSMEKGGSVKYYNEEQSYKLTPSNSIEKELLNKVNYEYIKPYFAGNFGWKTSNGKLADGYLYNLDDYDQNLIGKLKDEERLYRYFNRTSAIGGMSPLIKINIDKGLLYFLVPNDNDDIIFETKGVKALWINLIESKMQTGGEVGDENSEMVLNEAHQIKHHADELVAVLKQNPHVPAWVVAKIHSSAEQLSACTHFLAGEEGMTEYEKGGGVTNEVYIEFLNKDKGFKKDIKHFNSYEKAVKWAKENFEKFNPDMIKYEKPKMKTGGSVEGKAPKISFVEYAKYLDIKDDLIEPIYNIYMDRGKSSHTQKIQVSKAVGPENQKRLFKWFEWDGYLPLEIYNPKDKKAKGGKMVGWKHK